MTTIKAVQNYESLVRLLLLVQETTIDWGLTKLRQPYFGIYWSTTFQSAENLEHVSKGKLSPKEKTDLKLNVVGKIPEILLDNTDRNRTSPFAFTGNKFEFRAVGSNRPTVPIP
jgi:glutamine synthetase